VNLNYGIVNFNLEIFSVRMRKSRSRGKVPSFPHWSCEMCVKESGLLQGGKIESQHK